MKVRYPGLWREKLPSGAIRYRVLAKTGRKIRLHVTPEHPAFGDHYHAARAGIVMEPQAEKPPAIRGSVGWLIAEFSTWMDDAVASGALKLATVRQRKVFLSWLEAEAGLYTAEMPAAQLVKLRDKKAGTPGAADNFVKTVRAMYAWGEVRGLVRTNPAKSINKINQGEGARAWTLDDLRKYRERHPCGTMAHLALTIYMFTACRISDVVLLGKRHEVNRNGAVWLDWQPVKKGSRRVQIPILPPLLRATRAMKMQGPTYLLTDLGQPFASSAAFGNKFRDWVEQAGLEGLSSHGIRKAAGELLALQGATQYHIMAVHGHSSAKTSEIYTQGAERAQLAAQAMAKLDILEW